ncbi:DEAD/DEAH box helicase [Listeria monocytogenes]|uniref:DEAD/DEAH box helicase n=1 Tax=Listeria monocytogenes TaxID=1639 RepID=UPI0010E69BAF|nr:DEAD/DEAH box helicase [Listeria monocytogenes]EAD0597741.1 DEAD/DEAH box helicase [Listeria monocytogenes]
MTFIEELVKKALSDEYLKNLIYKIESIYGSALINPFISDNLANTLSVKEYSDLLRFSDILCRSQNAIARNLSFKIISLLFDRYREDKEFQIHAASVLTKLGNFPSLKIATRDQKVNIDEVVLDEIIKKTIQAAPDSEYVFTDSQYEVFERMKECNHFSFSGPTSFGKSFIFESFIKHIIQERNASDNIVILVPTRALINQVSQKLKKEIKNTRYKILSHPVVPPLYRKKDNRFIFVFTPERLIAYLTADNPMISFLFVDEAHKLLSEDDTRAPIFYHALTLAKRKSIKLFFASPNIPNTEIFLQLFGNSTKESLAITESAVAQNRFFVDCIDKRAVMFSEYGEEISIPYVYHNDDIKDLNYAIKVIGRSVQNIIYCNTIEDTINYALNYSSELPNKNNDDLEALIKLIETSMHVDYYLLDCLRKGVAFHFGGLPQRIREKIEILFREKIIDHIFCTSTLLEGVNLPAKNIFILSNSIGLRKFSDIDFWNLAGRAGRLTIDLSGNIICMRVSEKRNCWGNPAKDLQIVKEKKVKKASSQLMTNNGNFYKNIENSLDEKSFTRMQISENERMVLNSYGSILAYHNIIKTDSILKSNFIEKNVDGQKVLNKLVISNHVPEEILAQSVTIKIKYQNKILAQNQLISLPKQVTYSACLQLLNALYDFYNWGKEESGGKKPLAKNRNVLSYYAVLMNSWINSKPLSVIILAAIKDFDENGRSILLKNHIPEIFNKNNRVHVNKLINNVIYDIENIMRFKVKNYVTNYSLLIETKYNAVLKYNWSDYLEYGTTDSAVIDLQNLGFPRHLATLLKKNYLDCFEIEGDSIIDFFETELKNSFDRNEYPEEFLELQEILEW